MDGWQCLATMNCYSLLLIPMGYVLGSFPSSYLVGRIFSRLDLRQEGDGHVSATAVYRRAGLVFFIVTILLDIGKAVIVVLFSNMFTQNQLVILAAGLAAMVGHCWSVFIQFKGGLGATVIYGIMGSLTLLPFVISATVAIIFFTISRKSTLATVIFIIIISILIYVFKADIVLSIYPYLLLLLQYLKRIQVRLTTPKSGYKNEIFEDLKRVK